MLVLSLGLHLRDTLYFALKDEKTFVVEVNSATFEKGRHFCEVARTAVDGILARIALVGVTSYNNLRVRNNFKRVWPGLWEDSAVDRIKNACTDTHQVDDLSEVNFDRTFIKVGKIRRVMDELGKFALPHLGGTVPKYEQKGIDRVGLPRAIRSHDGRKRL